jgi:hypothetical protein
MDRNSVLFGKWSLGLFVVGALAPFFLAAFGGVILAVVFAGVCGSLALVLGVLGWSQMSGRVGVVGGAVLIVACFALVFVQLPMPRSHLPPHPTTIPEDSFVPRGPEKAGPKQNAPRPSLN